MTVAYPSNRKTSAGSRSKFVEELLRLTGATLVLAIFIMSGSLSRAELSPPQDKPASDAPSQPGTIAAYLGVPVT